MGHIQLKFIEYKENINNKLISVILPARSKSQALIKCIDMIADNADDKSRIEIILKIDDDDKILMPLINTFRKDIDIIYIISKRHPWGYTGLDETYNMAARISKGTFIWPMNDDSFILTKGYDSIVAKYKDIPKLLEPYERSFHETRPDLIAYIFIHRKIYELLGKMMVNLNFDVFWRNICNAIPELLINLYRNKDDIDVEVFHDMNWHEKEDPEDTYGLGNNSDYWVFKDYHINEMNEFIFKLQTMLNIEKNKNE